MKSPAALQIQNICALLWDKGVARKRTVVLNKGNWKDVSLLFFSWKDVSLPFFFFSSFFFNSSNGAFDHTRTMLIPKFYLVTLLDSQWWCSYCVNKEFNVFLSLKACKFTTFLYFSVFRLWSIIVILSFPHEIIFLLFVSVSFEAIFN